MAFNVKKDATSWFEVTPWECFRMGVRMIICGALSMIFRKSTVTVYSMAEIIHFWIDGKEVFTAGRNP